MAESTALQKLSLDGNDLSMVPPEHIAKGTNRLQEVMFRGLKGDIFLMLILNLFSGGFVFHQADRDAGERNAGLFFSL